MLEMNENNEHYFINGLLDIDLLNNTKNKNNIYTQNKIFINSLLSIKKDYFLKKK